MQIIVNKVENGYIITLNGKMYIMKNLDDVNQFMYQQFEGTIIEYKNVIIPHKENESITSDSE